MDSKQATSKTPSPNSTPSLQSPKGQRLFVNLAMVRKVVMMMESLIRVFAVVGDNNIQLIDQKSLDLPVRG